MSLTGKSRSGQLFATNDVVIERLLIDKDYVINADSTIDTLITISGKRSVNGVWRRLAPKTTDQGYVLVKYKTKWLSLHRVMYAKFVGNLEIDMTINHINGIKADNRPENLELITQSANNFHSFRTLNRKPVIGHKVINLDIANTIRQEHKQGIPYSKLSLKYGLSKGHISEIINNKIWVD